MPFVQFTGQAGAYRRDRRHARRPRRRATSRTCSTRWPSDSTVIGAVWFEYDKEVDWRLRQRPGRARRIHPPDRQTRLSASTHESRDRPLIRVEHAARLRLRRRRRSAGRQREACANGSADFEFGWLFDASVAPAALTRSSPSTPKSRSGRGGLVSRSRAGGAPGSAARCAAQHPAGAGHAVAPVA